MSDIALLVTGVFKTKQLSSPDLLKQPLVQLENGVKESTQGQLSQVNSNTQITPPEFLQPYGMSATPSAFTPGNILKNIKRTSLYKNTSSLAKFKILAKDTLINSRLLLKPVVKLADQQLVTGKQGWGSILVAKPRKENDPSLPNLSFGDSGVSVRVLQRLLISNGYAVRVDGGFGALTEAAVKAFQYRRNILPDGVVGQTTWRELTK